MDKKTITITLTDEEIKGLKDCMRFGSERLGIYSRNSCAWSRTEKRACVAYRKVIDAIEVAETPQDSPPSPE